MPGLNVGSDLSGATPAITWSIVVLFFGLISAIFFYPLVLVPVPIQLGKMASKSNELKIFINLKSN